jgi:hypothetical protein
MDESGLPVPCPGRVNRFARDAGGERWGYGIEPLRNDTGW